MSFTGTFDRQPISVQSTSVGCPSAGIVFEELTMLGARRLIRVGMCGALQPHMRMADTVIAFSASADDMAPLLYADMLGWSPAAPFGLVEEAARSSRQQGSTVHVGSVVTSSLFDDPTPWRRLGGAGLVTSASRWRRR